MVDNQIDQLGISNLEAIEGVLKKFPALFNEATFEEKKISLKMLIINIYWDGEDQEINSKGKKYMTQKCM